MMEHNSRDTNNSKTTDEM